jgi:uncharacterized protein YegP (UPF0339 family)
MKLARFDVYEDHAGEWRWRLLAPNGRSVAISGEGYTRERDAHRAVKTACFHAVRTRRPVLRAR